MRIMDVQSFKKSQYMNYARRRTSHFSKFMDKSVDFVTYFHICEPLSTVENGIKDVDSYIGKDSPVRYNRIESLPVYGFPVLTGTSEYNDETGFNAEFTGEIMIPQGVIEPVEGDCFILPILSEARYFIVTDVQYITFKSKPVYSVSFTNGIPDYLPQLNRQVVDNYIAVFDNIGTIDKVVVSSKEYDVAANLKQIYKDIHDYYIASFFNPRTTTFEIAINLNGFDECYIDRYLTNFLVSNRIIVLDDILKTTLVLDFNGLTYQEDHVPYTHSIYHALERNSMNKFKPTDTIYVKRLVSPFTLIVNSTDKDVLVTDKFGNAPEDDGITKNMFAFKYSYADIVDRIERNDIRFDTVENTIRSLIVLYFNQRNVPYSYFNIEYEDLDVMDQYLLLPLLLYIIRDAIRGLTRRNNIL